MPYLCVAELPTSPRIFVERCKYTNIFVTVQIIGHFFAYIIINGKSPRSSKTARRGDGGYRYYLKELSSIM